MSPNSPYVMCQPCGNGDHDRCASYDPTYHCDCATEGHPAPAVGVVEDGTWPADIAPPAGTGEGPAGGATKRRTLADDVADGLHDKPSPW